MPSMSLPLLDFFLSNVVNFVTLNKPTLPKSACFKLCYQSLQCGNDHTNSLYHNKYIFALGNPMTFTSGPLF